MGAAAYDAGGERIGAVDRACIPTDLLRTFVAICEVGSFTKVAHLFGLTQPAVSSHMRRLESMVGGDLLQKSLSGVSLTEYGVEVLRQARRILAINDQIVGGAPGGATRGLTSHRTAAREIASPATKALTTKAKRAVRGLIAPSRRIRSHTGRQRGRYRLVEYGRAVMCPQGRRCGQKQGEREACRGKERRQPRPRGGSVVADRQVLRQESSHRFTDKADRNRRQYANPRTHRRSSPASLRVGEQPWPRRPRESQL